MSDRLKVGDELRVQGNRRTYYGLVLYADAIRNEMRVRVRADGPEGEKLADLHLPMLLKKVDFAVICDSLVYPDNNSLWEVDDWDTLDYDITERLVSP